MAFKVKNKPIKKNIDKRITLDARYNKKINDIENTNKYLEDINKKIEKLEKTKKKLTESDYRKNIDKILEITDELIILKNKQKDLRKNDEISYLLDTGNILFEYYDKLENNNSGIINNFKKKNNEKTVSDYFNIQQSNNDK